MLYYLGLGAQQSDIKGQRWIRSAAKQGHGLARALYDKVFADQPPSELDVTNAVSRVRQAYLKNESEAAQLLDQLLAEARRREQQQQALEEETTLRERRAMRTLAGPAQVQQNKKPERIESVVPEFIGDATLEENRTLARGNIATIRVQAEKGLASSQYNLGRMYELGIKVPIDKTQALAWYKKAALQGYPDAEYRLAIALLYGSAAKHDHPVAKNLFANFVDESGARHHNTSIVVNWYMERALAGEAEAALRLGRIFEHGWGATINTREARSWYKRASLLGAQQADEYLQSLQAREAAQVTGNGQGSWLQSLKARLGLEQ
jgi:TPR repeat protein